MPKVLSRGVLVGETFLPRGFMVMILGFGAFVGVLTDRSRGISASVLAHGTWNGRVAPSFAVYAGGRQRFTGDPALLGKFGWIAALSMKELTRR